MKKMAKDIWELLVVGAAVFWIGFMFTFGVFVASDIAGVSLAIGYASEEPQ